MNLFRILGDLLHLASIVFLLHKIYKEKSVNGISLQTQALYAVIFICRYLDLFTSSFFFFYNTVLKILFITTSCTIVYMMLYKPPYCDTYDQKSDNFKGWILAVICFVLALIFNDEFTFMEVLWAFSIYLEAVAILPQLIVVYEHAKRDRGFVDMLTSHYVFCLGGYRAMYMLNWIYRYFTEDDYRAWIVWIAGTIQTAIYCDFFYYYIKAQFERKRMSLPL